jgi:small GTP-binding protein
MNIFIARQIINESIENNLTKLNFNSRNDSEKLSDLDLVELMPKILEISNLQELDLSNNELTILPENFGRLTNLTSLNLFGNSLKTLSKEVCALTNLRKLNVSFNELEDLAPEIHQLNQLVELDLFNNLLKFLPEAITELSNLSELLLEGNFLTDLPEGFRKLLNLKKLYLTGNIFTYFPHEITNLSNLEILALNQFQDTISVPFSFIRRRTGLSWKEKQNNLLAQGNQIISIPEEIYKLSKLEALYLKDNKLKELPFGITALEKLKSLNLEGNPLPFPAEILQDTYNPKKILNFINDYYGAKQEGKLKPLNEAKLVVVGEANVGKTCVINRLIHNEFVKTDSTHGIEIHRWKYVELENKHFVQLNVWDFGGQEIMHSTHQFFFTKRTVYILVINARENEDTNKTEEWLQRIQSLSQNSPVFIVGNKIDENNRGTDRTSLGYFDIERKRLLEKFPNLIKGFYGVSSDVGEKQFDFLFEDFRKALISEIGKLEEIHKEFPANWFDIKAQLEKMQSKKVPYITFRDYLSRCIKADIENEESQRTLIDFMHDLGIALSFQDDIELRDLAVLNPEWVTRGVYALIDNAQITLEKGILKREDIRKYLDEVEYPKETQDFIIKMMRKFRLLIDIKPDKVFLIPDLLPKDETDTGKWDDTLHFQYSYDIYEKSILRRFMVEVFHLCSKETYWRNGIVLKNNGNRALVKADVQDKTISIKIDGNQNTRREFIAVIRSKFAEIHTSFDGLVFKEMLGHPKYPEILRDYERLIKMEANNREFEFVDELEIDLPVKEWLNGFYSFEERRKKDMENNKFKLAEHLTIHAENVNLSQQEQGKIEINQNITKIEKSKEVVDDVSPKMDNTQTQTMEKLADEIISRIEEELVKHGKENDKLEEVKKGKWETKFKFAIPFIPLEFSRTIPPDEFISKVRNWLYGGDLQLNILEAKEEAKGLLNE